MIRKRKCNWCNVTYEYQRPSSKYCSARCRVRACQGVKNPKIKPFDFSESSVPRAETVDVEQDSPAVDAPLVAAVKRELEKSEQLESVAGQQAVRLAEAMSARETGSGLAALSKALTAVLDELSGGKSVSDDVLDELKARRDARRAG